MALFEVVRVWDVWPRLTGSQVRPTEYLIIHLICWYTRCFVTCFARHRPDLQARMSVAYSLPRATCLWLQKLRKQVLNLQIFIYASVSYSCLLSCRWRSLVWLLQSERGGGRGGVPSPSLRKWRTGCGCVWRGGSGVCCEGVGSVGGVLGDWHWMETHRYSIVGGSFVSSPNMKSIF